MVLQKPQRQPTPALHCEGLHMKVVQVTNENAKFALEVSSGMTNWVDDPEQTLKCLFLLSDLSKMRGKTICVHLERSL